MNLQSDDFVLMSLPRRFALDRQALDARWKDLQRQVHPDRFAAQGPVAQRLAAQWSARLNEAYRRLRDPLQRAAYLCQLHGVPLNAESNTAMPAQFLMQQMELREAASEATSVADFDALADQAARMQQDMLDHIAHQIDTQRDWAAAAQSVRALMFLDKLVAEISQRRQALA